MERIVATTASSTVKVCLDSKDVQIEAPFSNRICPPSITTTNHLEGNMDNILSGLVEFSVTADFAIKVTITVVGTMFVNSHKLALGWIRGGSAQMRSAKAKAAEPIDQKIYINSVTVWKREVGILGYDDDTISMTEFYSIPFSITIPEKCPASIVTDFYSVKYTATATVSAIAAPSSSLSTNTLVLATSDLVSFFVHSVRSKQTLQDSRAVVASEKSIDQFINLSVKTSRDEVVMRRYGGYGSEDEYLDLDILIDLSADVERVEDIEALREKGKVEHVRRIGEQVSLHIPINTKTFVKAIAAHSLVHKRSSPQDLRISISGEPSSIYADRNRYFPKSAGVQRAIDAIGAVKRKGSLSNVTMEYSAEIDPLEKSSEKPEPSGPLLFMRKLLSIGIAEIREKKQTPITSQSNHHGSKSTRPSILQTDLYYLKDESNSRNRTLQVNLNVPLRPKDTVAMVDRRPFSRLHDVVRTHYVVLRVKYLVKKDCVIGQLRHDRYVEVAVPIRLVVGRE
ncbi:hypothetical protein HK100_001152 [Physocladia obscura]|uniref:Uncharacterized protein n=1 Tax=Physocladia obscura TaxID=109957 RepID=A0AAD5SX78_9FUNG|nr:hypothetical protein HK100_001152 [Physocladia obscura]